MPVCACREAREYSFAGSLQGDRCVAHCLHKSSSQRPQTKLIARKIMVREGWTGDWSKWTTEGAEASQWLNSGLRDSPLGAVKMAQRLHTNASKVSQYE